MRVLHDATPSLRLLVGSHAGFVPATADDARAAADRVSAALRLAEAQRSRFHEIIGDYYRAAPIVEQPPEAEGLIDTLLKLAGGSDAQDRAIESAIERLPPALKALVWLYPVATILDVLATANHYWLDVITAPAVLALAYALAALPEYIRRRGLRRPGQVYLAVRQRARAR